MDTKEIRDMSDEDYFAELKLMFHTRGWSIFLQECRDNAMSINSVEDTVDHKDLWFRKGQLAVLSNILNTEESIRRAEEDQ